MPRKRTKRNARLEALDIITTLTTCPALLTSMIDEMDPKGAVEMLALSKTLAKSQRQRVIRALNTLGALRIARRLDCLDVKSPRQQAVLTAMGERLLKNSGLPSDLLNVKIPSPPKRGPVY